jgi:hypothetical protein
VTVARSRRHDHCEFPVAIELTDKQGIGNSVHGCASYEYTRGLYEYTRESVSGVVNLDVSYPGYNNLCSIFGLDK